MRAPTGRALKIGFAVFAAVSFLAFLISYLGVHLSASGGHGQVALVRVEGQIMDARNTVEEIRRFERNPRIRALVMRVDSPGGGVVPSQEIHDAVAAFKAAGKPVVTSMGTVAASGGYYIAAPSDVIMANPGTLTGSIGVIMTTVNLEGLMDKVGVENVTIKAGKNKDIGSPFRQMTAEERRLLQGVMDDIHNQFIEAVAEGRGKSVDEVRPVADGRIFSGRQALENGLVDAMGNLDQAIEKAGELAGIEGRPRVVEFRPSPLQELLGGVKGIFPWLPSGMNGTPVWTQVRALYMMSL